MIKAKNSNNEYVNIEDIKYFKSGETKDIEYIKDNIGIVLYSKYKEIETEILPTNFISKDNKLKNYRIYGNTVNGESTSDLVTEGEHSGEYCVSVKVEGKNLFDINMITANAFINVTTGGVTLSTTLNSNVSDFIPVLSGENYFFSFDAELHPGFTFVIAYYDEDKTYLKTKGNYNSSSNVYHYQLAFTPTKNGFIRIKYSSNSINMQVEKSSTATPYEPYHTPVTTNIYLPEQIKMVGGKAEYVDFREQKLHRVRRNLCDNDNLLIGFYSTSGAFNNDSNFRTSNFIAVHPNTNYTVSFFENGIRTGSLVTIFWNQSKQVIEEISTETFTTPQNCEYITIRNFASQSSALVNDYAFQVEKGSAVTEYEPYIENDEIDVVIPALPIAEGTNTLSIGTAVQPSKAYLKGKITEIN